MLLLLVVLCVIVDMLSVVLDQVKLELQGEVPGGPSSGGEVLLVVLLLLVVLVVLVALVVLMHAGLPLQLSIYEFCTSAMAPGLQRGESRVQAYIISL